MLRVAVLLPTGARGLKPTITVHDSSRARLVVAVQVPPMIVNDAAMVEVGVRVIPRIAEGNTLLIVTGCVALFRPMAVKANVRPLTFDTPGPASLPETRKLLVRPRL